MNEEMQNQEATNMNTPQQPVIPSAPVGAPAPESAPKKSRNMMLIFSVIVIVAVVILAAAGYFYYKNNMSQTAYVPPANTATNNATPSASAVSPTPVTAVESSSDLDKVTNELNSTDDSALQSDLNQANSEGNNL